MGSGSTARLREEEVKNVRIEGGRTEATMAAGEEG